MNSCMKRILNIFFVMVAALAVSSCRYNDLELTDRLDDIKKRVEALKEDIKEMNQQVQALGYLTNGNVITSVVQNSDGSLLVSYKDAKGEERSVVVAALSQMINVPVLGVEQDQETKLYYWTYTTVDGQKSYLLDENGQKIPVSGRAPVISTNEQGFWTVDGVVLVDAAGNPIEAKDGETAIFSDIHTDENGDLYVLQGNGTSFTLPVQTAFNLTLTAEVNTPVYDIHTPYVFNYDVVGVNASEAVVDIAYAEGVKAVVAKEEKSVSVTFDEPFNGGTLILFAHDFIHTVIRPVFFLRPAKTEVEIYTADDFMEFAAGVNSSNGYENMKAYLMNDIDMAGKVWVPIGNGAYTTGNVISGPSYKSEFDGQSHTIKNLTLSVSSDAAAGSASGLFGIVEGGVVKNVIIGEGSSFTSSAAAMSAMAPVVGYAFASSVENCQSHATISFNGGGDNLRTSIGGIVGGMSCSEESDASVKNCINHGKITSTNTVNTKNGGTGISIGGVVGFSDAKGTPAGPLCYIKDCVNNGEMDVQATRTAGIVASMNKFSLAEGCTNNARIACSDTKASNSRVAGIVSGMGTNTNVRKCINKGDILFTVEGNLTQGYAAGIVGQTNDKNGIYECENYGAVLSDIFKSATNRYIGLIVGNFNSKAATLTGCKVGGKIGPYSEDETYKVITVTEADYLQYICVDTGKAGSATVENNEFAGEPAPIVGIATVADLLEFRDLVNTGASYEKFQDESGFVVLAADIDCSSISEWVPIGNPETVANSNTACAYTGPSFKGKFDGKGHALYNLNLTKDVADAGTFGLFGVLDGATVQNLVLGTEGDKSSFTVSALGTADAGVFAGTVTGQSLINKCINNIPVKVNGGASGKRFATGAFVGFACSQSTTFVQMAELVNNAKAEIASGANTANGATCVMYGGIAGFLTGTTAGVLTTVENCRNNGDITAVCGRSSGLVATCNNRTFLRYCTNYGNVVNTFANGRVGNLTCIMGAGCALDDCTNYGNLTTSDSQTTTAGMVGLLNADDVVVTGGGNYGTIIGANTKYHGLLVANFSKFSKFDGVFAGGACGTYVAGGQPEMHELTKENFMQHIGSYSVDNLVKITNISSDFGTGGGEIKPVEIPDAPLRILCIGNSFTKDAMEHVPGLLAAAGEQNVVIAHCYYGGRTIPEYNNGWSIVSDYTLYISKPNFANPDASTWDTYNRKVSIKEVAEQGRWDIVTIQEHTGNYRAWSWTADEKNAIQGLIDKVKATQQTAPKFWYIMSQAYFNMGKIASASQSYITWTDQAGMFKVIADQGRKVMAETTMDGIIPTGTYLQNLRTSSIDNAMNLTRDGYHMDYGITRYGAACCVFESIITPYNGKKLDDNTYRYSSSSTSESAYSTPVTDANAPFALAAARYAIKNPWAVTDMSDFGKDDSGKIDDLPVDEGEKE